MFTKIERIISLRNLKPKKKEGFLKIISTFSFIGILLGVAILIIVMSVMNGFRVELTNKLIGFNPHIVVEPYNSPVNNNFKNLLKNKYKEFRLNNSYNGEAVVMINNSAKGVVVKGTNKNMFLKENIIEGNLQSLDNKSVVIGKDLAINLDLIIGDNINLISSNFLTTPIGQIPRQESYEIKAIFSSGFYEFDQNIIFLNLNETLSFFNKTEDDLILEIYLKDPMKANFFKKEIELINSNYNIYSWTDLNRSFFNALKIERNVMFIILALIIIVAAFNIISGLTILIKNKTKEIAILQTLGMSNKSITKSFFLTGFTIGFLATISGIILGTLFSFYIEDIRYFIYLTFDLDIFPADIYFLDEMPSEINILSLGIIFFFSIVVTALASYIPAKLVTKMNTIRALKYE